MDDGVAIERAIGVYLLFLSAIENIVIFTQLTWPISCYITIDYLNTDLSFVGYFSGLIPLSYSLGKLIGCRPISFLHDVMSIKCLLMILYLLSSISLICLGITTNFYTILICRFISGFCSNSQNSVKKYIKAIVLVQKTELAAAAKSSLWANKIGNVAGILIGSFLINPIDFLPVKSKFVERRYLLCCLIVFLLEVSGILLVFSIDTTVLFPKSKKYVELPEVKEKKEEDPGSSDVVTKEAIEIEKYLQSPQKNEVRSESLSNDDVKFYSPRNIANDLSLSRQINTARPNFHNSFTFDVKAETKEENRHEGEIKRTHISFIEEEFETVPEISKREECETKILENNDKNLSFHLNFAKKFRICFSFFIAMIVETIPYWAIF